MYKNPPIVVIAEADGAVSANAEISTAESEGFMLANFKTEYVDGQWRYSFVFTKEREEEKQEEVPEPTKPTLVVFDGDKGKAN